MSRLLSFTLCILAMIACGAEDEGSASFSFPATGYFGPNILDPSVASAQVGEDYSFRVLATGSEDPKLKVVITLLTPIPTRASPNNVWGWSYGAAFTWAVSFFDFDTGAQSLLTTPVADLDPGNSDLSMGFVGTGSARFDYYENGASEPTRSKQVDW